MRPLSESYAMTGRERIFEEHRLAMRPDDPRHGTANGYSNLGCRCSECCAAQTAYAKERGIGGYMTIPCPKCGTGMWYYAKMCRGCRDRLREAPHGSEGRYSRGCRCDDCRRAATTARRLRRQKAAA